MFSHQALDVSHNPPLFHGRTCRQLFLPLQDVFEREGGGGELVLLPEMPLPLPGHQAQGLVAVGLAQARDGDQPPGVSDLLHKVLGGRCEHFCHTAGLFGELLLSQE